MTSNIHPSGFDTIMPKTIATAAVDRLMHHAHSRPDPGRFSHRLAEALAGKGVVPSPDGPRRNSTAAHRDIGGHRPKTFRCPPASPSAVRTARSLRGR